MNDSISRRKSLQIIGASSAGLMAGGQAVAQSQPAAVRIAPVAGGLMKEWDSQEFTFDGAPALLVRVPKPAAGDRRPLEVRRGSEILYLTAYLLVCTHQGCKPAAPNPERNLICPCHGSTYRAADGSVVKGPAREMLEGIKLEVRQNAIFAVGFLRQ